MSKFLDISAFTYPSLQMFSPPYLSNFYVLRFLIFRVLNVKIVAGILSVFKSLNVLNLLNLQILASRKSL